MSIMVSSLYGIAMQDQMLQRGSLTLSDRPRHHHQLPGGNNNEELRSADPAFMKLRDMGGEQKPPTVKRQISIILEKEQKCEIVTWDHLDVGELLGKGAFNQVNAVTLLTSAKRDPGRTYAVKHVRSCFKHDEAKRETAEMDLAVEAKMLEHLVHDNIIRLHSVGDNNFLLLDRLFGTLDERLIKWRREEANPFKNNNASNKRDNRLIEVALPVARAMQYLHSRKIVFRDLKPANVGFGSDGVKLFDFGLARQIVDDSRKLTGMTGTVRYMAPEVFLSQHYGLLADAHSFALFFWELMTLRKPFEALSANEIVEQVMWKGVRPKATKKCGSETVQRMLRDCWERKPENRPSFSRIRSLLEFEASAIEQSNVTQVPTKTNRKRSSI